MNGLHLCVSGILGGRGTTETGEGNVFLPLQSITRMSHQEIAKLSRTF